MTRKKTARRPVSKSKKSKARQKRFIFGYPLFIFLLICAGAYLIATTFNVNADSIFVTAKVHAPYITSPAAITSPANGSYFTSPVVMVKGDCPENAAYVEIDRNQIMSGVAICNDNHNFQLSVNLLPGQNDLIARPFNITDDEGPASAPVSAFYIPPANGSLRSGTVLPLVLRTNFVYRGYFVNQPLSWPVSLSGGLGPYTIDVDWGDSLHEVIHQSAAGDFNIQHTYTSSGNYKNDFEIRVTAADSDNQKTFLQFFVIVNPSNSALPAYNIYNKPPTPPLHRAWLMYAWPAYASVLLLTSVFWLGERQELLMLKKKHLLGRRFYTG